MVGRRLDFEQIALAHHLVNLVHKRGSLTLEAVIAAHHHTAGRIACPSGAHKAKVVMEISMAGVSPYFEDRIFSGDDLPRSKPAPDVYLAAAATVWGYCPAGHGRAFEGLPGARVFRHMDELAAALARA